MAGCTKERFGGHAKKTKTQRGAGYGREKFEASKKKITKSWRTLLDAQKIKKMRKPSTKKKPKNLKNAEKNK